MHESVTAVVLAAGAGSRFGGGKLLAPLGGRPILQRVLDRIAGAGIDDVVVVLGDDAAAIEAAIDWRAERRVRNPDPGQGLSSSLRIGVGEVPATADAMLVALGDQPLVSVATIAALLDSPDDAARPIVVPVYPSDGGRNPVLVRRPAFGLVESATGDRGLGPIIAAHEEQVTAVIVDGDNPDVDTPADLATVVEEAWAERVRANAAQVERIREVPDGTDFYATVSSLFRADPTRTDDPVLNALIDRIRPGETWLDVGAGAGRFALPLARALDASGGEVIALDASPSMLEVLEEIAEDHAIENIRTIHARWPASGGAAAGLSADVALIAHVGYDIAAIGPFVDALEAAADRAVVAVLMERVPASAADPFWPPVHGETRDTLPALPDFLELLRARGRRPQVEMIEIETRRYESRDALEGFVRRQLWIDPAGPKEERFQAALDELTVQGPDGWMLRDHAPFQVGVVTWSR
jgi:molybdenum cofactor cytidylyltransferase